MRENTDQNNSKYGHFLRSVNDFNQGFRKIMILLNYLEIRNMRKYKQAIVKII